MPLHDWSKVEAGIFHDFHTVWIAGIRNALNGGLLPADFYALAEVADVMPATKMHESVPRNPQEIHVLLVDVFAPGRYDPRGLHYQIRNVLAPYAPGTEFTSPRSTLASYQVALKSVEMFVEHVQANANLPDMPIFLDSASYVNIPLEGTYLKAWQGMPAFWRNVITGETQ